MSSVTGVTGIASCTRAENVYQWDMVENVGEQDGTSCSYHFLVKMYCQVNFPLKICIFGLNAKKNVYYMFKAGIFKVLKYCVLLSWSYLVQKLACGEMWPAGMLAILTF